jgi:hypothetical protein
LQSTASLVGRTQERLATGLKVNSAIDDALAFFKAGNLNSRANDLSSIKDTIANGISTIRAAIQGLESMESIIKQMKALAQSAISSPESSTRAKLASQFNELRSQIYNLAEDAQFNGYNLLKNDTNAFIGGADMLTVKFNERIEPRDHGWCRRRNGRRDRRLGRDRHGRCHRHHSFYPRDRFSAGDRTPDGAGVRYELGHAANPYRFYAEPHQHFAGRRGPAGQRRSQRGIRQSSVTPNASETWHDLAFDRAAFRTIDPAPLLKAFTR